MSRFKRNLLLAFLALNALSIATCFSFAFFPQIYLQSNLVVSESSDPPADLAIPLQPNHTYFLRVTTTTNTQSSTELELNLMLDNSLIENWVSYTSPKRHGLGTGHNFLNFIIPVDPALGGLFEIIVVTSDNIDSVDYAVFQDVPEYFLGLIDLCSSGFLSFFLMGLMFVGFIW